MLDPVELQCMEIWGGVEPLERAVRTPGLDIWVHSQPYQGDEQGGDVYYVTLCGGGLITRVVVADVSGHGAVVSDFSKSLRSMVRKAINQKSQDRLVAQLNRQFAEMAELRRFATAVVATYLASTDQIAICNAGHPRPLLYRAATGAWELVVESSAPSEGLVDLPLGLDEETSYRSEKILLDVGDRLIFYTDALSEAADAAGTMLGSEGLRDRALQVTSPGQSPADLGQRLLEAVAQYRADQPADDDVTLVVLHHTGSPSRRPGLGEKLSVYAKFFGLKDF